MCGGHALEADEVVRLLVDEVEGEVVVCAKGFVDGKVVLHGHEDVAKVLLVGRAAHVLLDADEEAALYVDELVEVAKEVVEGVWGQDVVLCEGACVVLEHLEVLNVLALCGEELADDLGAVVGGMVDVVVVRLAVGLDEEAALLEDVEEPVDGADDLDEAVGVVEVELGYGEDVVRVPAELLFECDDELHDLGLAGVGVGAICVWVDGELYVWIQGVEEGAEGRAEAEALPELRDGVAAGLADGRGIGRGGAAGRDGGREWIGGGGGGCEGGGADFVEVGLAEAGDAVEAVAEVEAGLVEGGACDGLLVGDGVGGCGSACHESCAAGPDEGGSDASICGGAGDG